MSDDLFAAMDRAWHHAAGHVGRLEVYESLDGAHARIDVTSVPVRTVNAARAHHTWHTKHLYCERAELAGVLEDLASAGAALLPDMMGGAPVHEHHAAVDRNDIALERSAEPWKLLYRRPL